MTEANVNLCESQNKVRHDKLCLDHLSWLKIKLNVIYTIT